jgi:hypothetical protein
MVITLKCGQGLAGCGAEDGGGTSGDQLAEALRGCEAGAGEAVGEAVPCGRIGSEEEQQLMVFAIVEGVPERVAP